MNAETIVNLYIINATSKATFAIWVISNVG